MILEMTAADIPVCVGLIRESFLTVAETFGFTEANAPRFTAFAMTEERLRWQFYEEHRPMLVYWKKGTAVGYYSLAFSKSGMCELNNLCVHPAYRHNGVGETLLRHAFATAEKYGCTNMEIGIVEENQVLKTWYESFGFVSVRMENYDFFPFTCEYMIKTLSDTSV